MKFATIGTSGITEEFLQAVKSVRGAKLVATYSRDLEKAKALAKSYGAKKAYDDVDELVADEEVEAVYIASPIALHAMQAIKMMMHGKHVLCEKSLASNLAEAEAMFRAAEDNNVILMEAMRPIHDPGYALIKKNLKKLGRIRKIYLNFSEYSRRYNAFKEGEITSVFEREMSGGALMDVGVYCVESLIGLFGMPEKITSAMIPLKTGVDGAGKIIATYPGAIAEMDYSKITTSDNCCTIEGEDATLYYTYIRDIDKIEVEYNDGRHEEFEREECENNMVYEIKDFINMVKKGENMEHYRAVSLNTMRMLDGVRMQNNMRFPADQVKTK